MLRKLNFGVLLLAGAMMLPALVSGQGKSVKPLAENASLTETQDWLIEAIRKYGSYKSRVSSVSISSVKFDNCALSIALVRKSGSTAQDTMGVTTRTSTVKQEVAFDLSFVEPDGIQLADHIFPELRMITIRFRPGNTTAPSDQSLEAEIVVKGEAGEQIHSALIQARRLCVSNK